MVKLKVEVKGMEKLKKYLNSKHKLLEKGITNSMKETGEELKTAVKESIEGKAAEPRSVDSGEFLNSVSVQSTNDSAVVSSDVPQSVFMEFGTSRGIEARSHFRNSLNRERRKIIDTIKDGVFKSIK